MNIVISNDDGIHSQGLRVLVETLAKEHRILVVAPDEERSAASHSLTLMKPMKLELAHKTNRVEAYSFGGSPADCVKFALTNFSAFSADMVVSGINVGSNLGTDVIYSGTVSCAREAATCGVKSVAVSSVGWGGNLFQTAADFVAENLELFYRSCRPDGFFNVNVPSVPKKEIAGVRVAPLGVQLYTDIYHEDPLRPGHFRMQGEMARHERNDAGCDVELVKNNYITVTPLLLDTTDYPALSILSGVEFR